MNIVHSTDSQTSALKSDKKIHPVERVESCIVLCTQKQKIRVEKSLKDQTFQINGQDT